jgi:hypothetical protein
MPCRVAGAVSRKLAELLGVDLRSLGLVRIGVALLLLADLALRARDLEAHYTDAGVLPRERLAAWGPRAFYSLHALVGDSPLAVGVLFAVAALVALALLAGWHTRLATFLSWLLLWNLQWRNPPLNTGGDVMLRLLLFWGMLLPWGARFALVPRRAAPGRPPDAFVSAASAALLLQVCFVYWFAVAHRTGPVWWEGKALFYALHYDQFTTGLGIRLRGLGPLLPVLSLGALWLEMLGPFLAFVPVRTGPFRCAAVALFLSLHGALALTIALGLFPAVFCVAWLAFLPAWFWDRLLPRLGLVVAPRPGGPATSPLWLQALAALALALVLGSNLRTVFPELFLRHVPRHWEIAARWLELDQRWGLYAPDPPRYDGWYVLSGVRADGETEDLLRPGQPADFAKPELVSGVMNLRWRRFFFDQELRRGAPAWRDTAAYLCRRWGRTHAPSEQLARVRIYYVRETTLPDGPEREGVEVLFDGGCPGADHGSTNAHSAAIMTGFQ